MPWLSGWNYRKSLTFDHDKIDSALSDFPVAVILSNTNFHVNLRPRTSQGPYRKRRGRAE